MGGTMFSMDLYGVWTVYHTKNLHLHINVRPHGKTISSLGQYTHLSPLK